MRTPVAAVGSAVFFVVAPGVVAGVVPWWLTRWRVADPTPFWMIARVVGALLVLAGLVALIRAFARFVLEGHGTPAPVAPTERLVIGGLYRYVRNPMYVAVLAIIAGQGLALGQLVLLWYALIVWVAVAGFVRVYEEPTLVRQFGASYEAYRRAVPAWIPRLSPWEPDDREGLA
ncbi:MAG TPA: isoprenylcysteine carboxylmethyltransferase family protein [Euzebyales bacterium]|nr:isoprenylcysteine carboxylmethyltransferase family protein [Euzebyales bacterium]